jgi:hypothetical protein
VLGYADRLPNGPWFDEFDRIKKKRTTDRLLADNRVSTTIFLVGIDWHDQDRAAAEASS